MGTKTAKGVKCPICKDTFEPKTKRQKVCTKAACKKEHTNTYMREYMRKRAQEAKASSKGKKAKKAATRKVKKAAPRKAKKSKKVAASARKATNAALKARLRRAQKALLKANAVIEEVLA